MAKLAVTDHTSTRRKALKKALAVTTAIGSVSALPNKWTKPLVDTVILPAHAMCSISICVPFAVASISRPSPFASNSMGLVEIVLTVDVPDCDAITIDSLLMNNGEIQAGLPATVYAGSPIGFTWTGIIEPALEIPATALELIVNSTCADGTQRTQVIPLPIEPAQRLEAVEEEVPTADIIDEVPEIIQEEPLIEEPIIIEEAVLEEVIESVEVIE